MARNGKIALRPVSLREGFIQEVYDGSQTWIDHTEYPAQSCQIVPNPGKSWQ